MNVSKTFTDFAELRDLSIPFITKQALRGTKIGKILRREFLKKPCYQQESLARELEFQVKLGTICWHVAEHVQRLKIMSTVEEIAAIYDDPAVKSCMTGEGTKLAPFYVANGFQLATLWQDGRLMGRSLIKNGAHGNVYGDQQEELSVALQELGYRDADQHDLFFAPGTEFIVPGMMLNTDGWNYTGYYIPYLDQLGNRLLTLVDQDMSCLVVRVQRAHDPKDCEDEELWLVKDWCADVEEMCRKNVMRVIPMKEGDVIFNGTHDVVEYQIKPAQIVFMESTRDAYRKLVRELEDYEELCKELEAQESEEN